MSDEESEISWLSELISVQRRRIGDLLGKLGRYVNLSGLKPTLLARLFDMLQQVGPAKEKEANLFSRIEALEKLHHARRKQRLLAHAEAPRPTDEPVLWEDAPAPPRKNGILYLLWYALFMGNNPKNNQ